MWNQQQLQNIFLSSDNQKLKLFQSIIDNSPDVICLTDSEGIIIYISPSVEKLIGYSPEELTGKKIFDFIHPNDLNNTTPLFDQISRPGSSVNAELRASSKKDEWRWIDISGINFLHDPELNSIFFNFRDITERKNTEKALRESEERFRHVIEQTGQLIYDYNVVSGEIKWAGAIKEITGYTEKEFKSFDIAKWEDSLHPEDKDYAVKLLEEKMIACSNYNIEYRFKKKCGTYVYLYDNGVFIADEAGNAVRMLGTMTNITKRKQSEQIQSALFKISEAAHKTENLDKLFSSIHSILNEIIYAKNFYISLVDHEKQLLSFPYFVDETEDPPGAVPLGRGLTEYVIKHEKPLLASPEVFEELIKNREVKALGGASIDWLGVPLKTKGKVIGVMVIQSYEENVRFSEEDKNIMIYVSDQVAMAIERKSSEEQLKNYTEDLKASNKSKDTFFSIISHDLKTPFISLLGLSEYLAEDINVLSKNEIKELSSALHKSSKNLYSLIDNLLQWSKLQFGKLDFSPVEFNLADQIKSIIDIYDSSFTSKNIILNSKIKGDQYVYADRYMIDTVLRNLISNALKFTENGGAVYLTAEREDGILKISVIDEGVGMDIQTIKKVFENEDHYTTQGTNNEKGSGLGLELCKKFIAFHGGKLVVESQPGKGTKCSFTLPAVEPSA